MPEARAPSSLAVALKTAVDAVRAELGRPHALVSVVAPTRANAQLARRALAETGSFIRVDFETPDALVLAIGRVAALRERAAGRPAPVGAAPPPGWLEATLAARLPTLAASGALGEHGATLCQPAWLSSLADAVRALERGRITPAALRALTGAEVAPRARLLAGLLEAVAAARAEDGLGDGEALVELAGSVAREGRIPESARRDAFVIFGDGVLDFGTFGVLREVFARAIVRRVALPPFEHIAPAPLGLRLAAGAAPVVTVGTAGAGASGAAATALDHLRARLFGPGLAKGPSDGSVVLARTPDEIRELDEAVRVVVRAIGAGVALDRIAIALPDGDAAHALDDLLARAQIPATWLVGPPLARSTPARFLALALALADAERASISDWYELLRFPGVLRELRRRTPGLEGVGQWRKLLSTSGASRGTAHLLAALRERAAALEAERDAAVDAGPGSADGGADGDGADGDGSDDAREDAATARLRELHAARSLVRAIEALAADLATLPTEGRLADHARALAALLERGQPASQASAQLERALDAWAGHAVGPVLTRARAAALLAAELEATQSLRGSLDDRTIRVLPPMALLGGDFDVVCVLGLTQGRFPKEAREDPLLSDALVAALNAAHPGGDPRLVPSAHRADAERRRFAAAVAATRGSLWLSIPRSDLMDARPSVPGPFALEVASALAGRRVGYRGLTELAVVVGARDAFAPAAAVDATTAPEHLLARLGADADDGLAALAAHPWARGLLQLYRSIDRRVQSGALDAWSGLVPAAALVPHPAHPAYPAHPDDRPGVLPWQLAAAIATPTDYFARVVLGAQRPAWLGGRSSPTDKWIVARWMKDAVAATLDGPPPTDLDAAFFAAWDVVAARELRHRGEDERADLPIARALAGGLWDALREAVGDLVGAARRPLDGLPIASDLPWRLAGASDHVHGDRVVGWEAEKLPAKERPEKLVARGLQVLALAEAGAAVDRPQLLGVDGTHDDAKHWTADGARDQARAALERMTAGRWPPSGGPLRLHREPAAEDLAPSPPSPPSPPPAARKPARAAKTPKEAKR